MFAVLDEEGQFSSKVRGRFLKALDELPWCVDGVDRRLFTLSALRFCLCKECHQKIWKLK
jgi:hypothetical protein